MPTFVHAPLTHFANSSLAKSEEIFSASRDAAETSGFDPLQKNIIEKTTAGLCSRRGGSAFKLFFHFPYFGETTYTITKSRTYPLASSKGVIQLGFTL